jgi:hypothetical protein
MPRFTDTFAVWMRRHLSYVVAQSSRPYNITTYSYNLELLLSSDQIAISGKTIKYGVLMR